MNIEIQTGGAPLTQQKVKAQTVTIVSTPKTRSDARFKAIIMDAMNKAKVLAPDTIRTWAAVTEAIGLPIVPPFVGQPFSHSALAEYLTYMEVNGVSILEGMSRAESTPLNVTMEYRRSDNAVKLGNGIKLLPQQEKVFEALKDAYRAWKANPTTAPAGFIIPLKPGKGKSFIVDAFLVWLQEQKELDALYSAFILTPSSVVDKTTATARRLGVTGLDDARVVIDSHQSVSSMRFKGLFIDSTVDYYGNAVKRKQYIHTPPKVAVIDESHLFKKMASVRTKYIMAWVDAGQTFFVFTSATPFVTLADTEFFCLAARVQWLGMPITREKFKAYINDVRGRSTVPIDEPNDAANQRFRERNANLFLCPPDDPQKVRAYNHTVVVDFATKREQDFYFDAEARWVESKKREGRSTDGSRQAMFTVMRMAEESAKVTRFGERALKFYNEGFAPVVDLSFQESLIDYVIYLTKRGVPRNDISIVWGGSEIVNPKDLLSEDEAADLIFRRSKGEELDKKLLSRLKKTIRHIRDTLRRHMTYEEKLERDEYIRSLGLNAQDPRQRFMEVERFLDGKTTFCVFTLAAGGTGIDLDHQRPNNRPRSLDSTVCYYGEEFLQALGRCMRAATLSNVHQHILYMRGTIAHLHVAPKLDPKLKSIHRLATGGEDYVQLLENLETYESHKDSALYLPESYRTTKDMEQEEPEVFGDEPTDNDDDDSL